MTSVLDGHQGGSEGPLHRIFPLVIFFNFAQIVNCFSHSLHEGVLPKLIRVYPLEEVSPFCNLEIC